MEKDRQTFLPSTVRMPSSYSCRFFNAFGLFICDQDQASSL